MHNELEQAITLSITPDLNQFSVRQDQILRRRTVVIKLSMCSATRRSNFSCSTPRLDDRHTMDETSGLPALRSEPASMLALIGELARDPAVDHVKLEALLRMQERIEDRQREAAFNEAFARLMPRLPRITKRGRIEYPANTARGTKASSIRFAKWEDIDAAIRSILHEEGFSLSYDTEQLPSGAFVRVGHLHHVSGHHKTSRTPPMPLDTSGGKNNLQGAGSAASYGNRYTTRDLLNLVFEGEDDDGVEGGKDRISQEQFKELDDLRRSVGMSAEKFCDFWNVQTISDLDVANFVPAMNGLNAMKARRKGVPE